MSAHYAIKRVSDDHYWRGADLWTEARDRTVRLFEYIADAEDAAFTECPAPIGTWAIVPVETLEDPGDA